MSVLGCLQVQNEDFWGAKADQSKVNIICDSRNSLFKGC